MSRNLCQVECQRCGAIPKRSEEPRPITENEAGVYFPQFRGLIVANADCPDCGAKYLAWVDETEVAWSRERGWHDTQYHDGRREFFDLSFRSTFNDEPGEDDLPPWIPPVQITLDRDDVQYLLFMVSGLYPTDYGEIERLRSSIEKALNAGEET